MRARMHGVAVIWVATGLLFLLSLGVQPETLSRGSLRGMLPFAAILAIVAAGQTLVPKAGCEPKRFVREFRTDGEEHGLAVGQTLTVATFAEIPRVDVIGTIKGRGTTGVMKRHNFHGQCASHGVKRVHRHGGSIGSSADPSRVLKGTRMAGRYGGSRVTMRNLKVVRVDEPSNMLLVAGAVPGPGGSWVIVRRTKKKRKVRAKAK